MDSVHPPRQRFPGGSKTHIGQRPGCIGFRAGVELLHFYQSEPLSMDFPAPDGGSAHRQAWLLQCSCRPLIELLARDRLGGSLLVQRPGLLLLRCDGTSSSPRRRGVGESARDRISYLRTSAHSRTSPGWWRTSPSIHSGSLPQWVRSCAPRRDTHPWCTDPHEAYVRGRRSMPCQQSSIAMRPRCTSTSIRT